jgi:hypothetical protein
LIDEWQRASAERVTMEDLRAPEVERAYTNAKAVFWVEFPLFHFCHDGVVVALCSPPFAVH